MLEQILNRLDISHLRLLIDEQIKLYLLNNDLYTSVLDDYDKIISIIIEDAKNTLFEDPQNRIIISNALEEDELMKLSKVLGYKFDTSVNFLNYIYQFKNNKKINSFFLDFFNITIDKNLEKENYYNYAPVLKERFYELLDYQVVIKEQVLQLLKCNPILFRLIIHMPTGTGKTKTTNHIVINNYVNTLKKRGVILWLAHTKELITQAYKTFYKTWYILGDESILIKVNDFDYVPESKAIIFMSYQKLISLKKNNNILFQSLIKNVSSIVADEAHKCLALETRSAIEALMIKKEDYNNKHLIGLTATPGRKFGEVDDSEENHLLAIMFERRIFSIEPKKINYMKMSEQEYNNVEHYDKEIIRYFQNRGVLSRIKREILTYNYSFKNQKILSNDINHEVLFKFSKIQERNNIIINRLIDLDSKDIPTILFACSVQHGKFIQKVLQIVGIKSKGVYGSTAKQLRESYINEFNNGEFNILINFEVLTTGFDSPRIQCVFITRPTNSIVLYSQMLGRGLRGPMMGGNETCLLIDIEDNYEKFSDENIAFKYFAEYWEGR